MNPSDQLSLPLPRSIPEQAEDAAKRLTEWINRSAGQHRRAVASEFNALRERLMGEAHDV